MSSPIPAPPPDASATKRGLLSLVAQVMGAGIKKFPDGIKFGDDSLQTTAATSPDLSAYETIAGAASKYLALIGGTLSGAVLAPAFEALAAGAATIKGKIADSDTAVSIIFDAATSLVTAGAKIASFRNAGTEQAYVYKDGTYYTHDGSVYAAAHRGTGFIPGVAVVGSSGSEPYSGVTLAAYTAISNALSKIATLGHTFGSTGAGYVEKAYFGRDGNLVVSGVASGATAVAVPQGSYVSLGDVTLRRSGGGTVSVNDGSGGLAAGQFIGPDFGTFQNTFAKLFGSINDGAAAVAVILKSNSNLTTAGSKIVSIRNNDVTEKAYFNKDGMVAITGTAAGDVAVQVPDGSRIGLNGATQSRYLDWQGGSYNFAGGNGAPVAAGQYQCSAGAGENALRLTTLGAFIRLSTTGPFLTANTGSPEGVLAAPVGSLYSRTDGGAATSFYVKESGTGNTGWVAK